MQAFQKNSKKNIPHRVYQINEWILAISTPKKKEDQIQNKMRIEEEEACQTDQTEAKESFCLEKKGYSSRRRCVIWIKCDFA